MPRTLFIATTAAALISCQNDSPPQTTERVPIEITITNNNENQIEVVIESEEDGDNLTMTTTVTQTDNKTVIDSVCQINGNHVTDNTTCPDNVTGALLQWLEYSHQ